LQHIHGSGVEHAAEIGQIVAVFAGGDVHAVRPLIADQV
jgi:hypothetical protein